jgi:hypothetical protein
MDADPVVIGIVIGVIALVGVAFMVMRVRRRGGESDR